MSSLLKSLIIVVVSCAVGAGSAVLRGLPWTPDREKREQKERLQTQVKDRHAQMRDTMGISLEQFKEAIASGSVIIDARPKSEFDKAHLSIDREPPVLNIEPHNAAMHFDRLQQLAGQPLVIYCTSDTCELGEELVVALEPYGFFPNTRIFFPGWEGIVAAKLPQTSGPDTWTPDGAPGGHVAPPEDAEGASPATTESPDGGKP